MSDYYEYYLNNPHEIPGDDEMHNPYEWIEEEVEEAADDSQFVYDLLADEYVDFEVTKSVLRAMFKSYVTRMHATKQEKIDEADKDLLIFSKGLMAAMYEATNEIVINRRA